jgi:hypothetical protein
MGHKQNSESCQLDRPVCHVRKRNATCVPNQKNWNRFHFASKAPCAKTKVPGTKSPLAIIQNSYAAHLFALAPVRARHPILALAAGNLVPGTQKMVVRGAILVPGWDDESLEKWAI